MYENELNCRSALLVTVVEVTTSYGSIAVLSASTWLTVKPSFSNLLKAAFNATSLVDGDNPSINWISENIHIVALVPVIIIFIHSLYFVVSRETYDSTVQSSMVQLAFVCLFHFLCGAIISFTFCVLTLEKFIDEYIIVLDDSRRLSVLDILIYTGLCIYIVIICPLISNLEFKMKLVLYLMRPKYLSTSATVSKISESAEPRPIVKEKSCDEKSIRHGDLKHVQQPITESVLIEDPACQYSVFEP